MLDEVVISRAITESFMKVFMDYMDVDVAIAGAGPAGLVCAYYLARAGKKVAVYERHLKVGGGMPGGGMMFNRIVIQDEARPILQGEIGVDIESYKDGMYIADSVEAIATITSKAIKAGVKIFNLMSVEDVMIRENKVSGVVLNWSSVGWSKLHVDPLCVRAKAVVDATGHDTEVCKIVERKSGPVLNTKTGGVLGEKSMWAEVGEGVIMDNTKEVYPGLYVCGMASNGVYGSPRMGAIFGGMILSGKKAATLILQNISR
ncbi:MAG TPA: ribose 1,5-bisphosphate isomerase [Elusimicrobia bacterium]|nr:MAG: ribose 1,5-bisphosphate isomerase [Elusimicrobia bacterium RIFOXYA12_FULL_49_49]OGS06244.1 MAG: ribose 1,5-bisphosphate isomerase [Elusimicrobia bacterium RIFOXYA1_FULL_47_7]OGS14644.1 MAG: ribose 1,5-bisphosphate isomerase [Elusimicrobia bacterium RIFOXYA2_FULL_47_53]OGS25703.1 MAG: ribose 1,5-bisphosphate isomerase [Elusimicrobia bacterium RIFOXYB12_FULL_50_12]OGS31735.1 MAG: ribose 1,5-bisphosphate isomerase [Elusimicrobia bacterium RIFOXYB2_FULL_46_23]HBU69737.1 ribose 1,5-bisphosp